MFALEPASDLNRNSFGNSPREYMEYQWRGCQGILEALRLIDLNQFVASSSPRTLGGRANMLLGSIALKNTFALSFGHQTFNTPTSVTLTVAGHESIKTRNQHQVIAKSYFATLHSQSLCAL